MFFEKTFTQSVLIAYVSVVSMVPAHGQSSVSCNYNSGNAKILNQQIASLPVAGVGGLQRQKADAMSLYQAAQFSLAEEAFRRLSVLEPADASHHYWVAESCYEQSHYIDSIAEFSRSLALSPDDEISQVRLVESVLASRNFSQAKASAAKALDRVKNLRLRERLSSVVQISSKGMPLPPDTSSRSQFGCETGRSK